MKRAPRSKASIACRVNQGSRRNPGRVGKPLQLLVGVPPVRPGDDEWRADPACPVGLDQSSQVLARLNGAGVQHVTVPLQPKAGKRLRDGSAGRGKFSYGLIGVGDSISRPIQFPNDLLPGRLGHSDEVRRNAGEAGRTAGAYVARQCRSAPGEAGGSDRGPCRCSEHRGNRAALDTSSALNWVGQKDPATAGNGAWRRNAPEPSERHRQPGASTVAEAGHSMLQQKLPPLSSVSPGQGSLSLR